jgi:hypothetical protein
VKRNCSGLVWGRVAHFLKNGATNCDCVKLLEVLISTVPSLTRDELYCEVDV